MSTGLFFSLPYHGHINPCVPVIEELLRRGDEIIVYTTDSFRPMMHAIGASFRSFPYELSDRRTLVVMADWQLSVASSRMRQLISEARQLSASYILCDPACHWGYALAEHLGLPLISLHSTYPQAFHHISRTKSMLLDIRQVPTIVPIVIRFLLRDWWFARTWGVRPLLSPIALVQPREALADLVLADEFLTPTLPDDRYTFVGPCLRRPGCTRGEPLPQLDRRPVVYIALGTLWNLRPDFYRLCIEAFSDSDYQVIMAIGTDLDPQAFGVLPTNIHVRQHVDQIEALSLSAVFISHGGMNSLNEALAIGIPLVLMPQANDQFPLSSLMQEQGIGILLPSENTSAADIRSAIDRALRDEDMLARCRAHKERLRSKGSGAPIAADLIAAALRRGRPASKVSASDGRLQ